MKQKAHDVTQEETKNEQNLSCIKVLSKNYYFLLLGIYFFVCQQPAEGWDEDSKEE